MDQDLNGAPRDNFQVEFKPNMYPIMYWALAFGAASGVAMFLLLILSQYINIIWVPVFLVGLVWGGYRNYQKQKAAWQQVQGLPARSGTPAQEFRQAVGDVMNASREMMAENRAEEQVRQAQLEQELLEQQQVVSEDEQNQPPLV